MKSLIITILLLVCLTAGTVRSQNVGEVRNVDGFPALYINDTLYPPFAYMSYLGETEYYKEVAAAGTHLYCFPAYLGDRGINAASGIGLFRTPIWTGENRYDYSSIREDFEKIIAADPSARIIIRIYLDPPRWWEEKNPEYACHLPGGGTFRQCFASEKWKSETGTALRDCIRWLQDSPYAGFIVGIHVAAGSTEEWFYHAPQRDDRNPLRTTAFRKWLSDKYGGDPAGLKNAWQDSTVTFATAVPIVMDRPPEQQWLMPSKQRRTMDSYQFHAEVLADDIAYFCGIVKDATDRKWLTGAFYGYHGTITDPRFGHGALGKLLKCPDIDYLSSPNKYYRVIGEDWPPMVAAQSVRLHGKLWLAENDTRTCLTTLLKEKAPQIPPPGQYETGVWLGPEDMQTSLAFLWKNAGRMLTQGYGGWWFDMWGGWYHDPQMLEVVRSAGEFYAAYSQQPESSAMKPQVCVVADEQLCFSDASYGALTERIVSNTYPMAKTGAPFDHYLRTDLAVIPSGQYKVVWLLGFLELSEAETRMIGELRLKGVTVMWTDADGTRVLGKNGTDFVKDFVTFTDSQLRSVWKDAGVHIYDDSGDVFYIGRGWLCLHSVFGGERTISLPCKARVSDPVTGAVKYRSTRTIRLTVPAKSTVLLRVTPL